MLRYILKEGFSGFKRAKLLSIISIATIVITLILMGVFVKVSFNASSILDQVRSRFEIEFFLSDVFAIEEKIVLENQLTNTTIVESFRFVSKDDAAKIFEKEFGENIVQLFGTNPLPPSYKIKIKPEFITAENIDSFIKFFENNSSILEKKYNLKFLQSLQRNANILVSVGICIGLLFIIISLILISNTTRMAIVAKQEVIRTMKLVGATYSYIIIPFILEAIYYGLLAGIISAGLFFGLETGIDYYFPAIQQAIPIDTIFIYVIIIGFGTFLGFIGSLFSIRKFIKI